MQKEVTIILPLYTNDGRLQESTVNKLVKRIASVGGGLAYWKQTGIEIWHDATYKDVSLRVVSVVDSIDKVIALRDIALDAIDLLHQRGGICFQVIDVQTEFLSRLDVQVRNEEKQAAIVAA